MMDRGLPEGRKGQVLAVALVVFVICVVWFAVISPLVGWYAQRARFLISRQQTAAHMEAIVASLPGLKRAAANKRTGAVVEVLLPGNSDALAAAALQQRVQGLATAASAALSSVEVVPATKVGRYQQIGLRISMEAPYSSLIRLLTMIEQGPPRMFVDDLTIRAPAYDLNLPMLELTRSESLSVFAFRDGTAVEPPAHGVP